ncbi:MAG TPA: hypothetical protein VFB62_12950 [Polyangiaceae bacterium]|nr:hypothetical protein [Polyangiaceae bacterium]
MSKPVDAGTLCATGICNAEGTCQAGAGGGLGFGEPCTSSEVCASGNCADGVCCESACDGVCESCNLAGREGTCAADAEGTDPADECVGEAACDGSGACRYGEHLWSKKFPTAWLGDVAVDGQGNIVAVGNFTGTVSFGGPPMTAIDYDVFVAKFDVDGRHLWSKRFGDVGGQGATAVAVNANGDICLGGDFAGVINFGGSTLSNADVAGDIFVAKLSGTGTHSWSKSFAVSGNTGSDEGEVSDIIIDQSGNVIFTGKVDSNVNFGGGTLAGASGDPYLVKLSSAGTHTWSKVFPGSGGDAVGALPGGDVIWAGTFPGTTNLGGAVLTAGGTSDIFLARFSATGAHVWSTRFGQAMADARSIDVDDAGRILLGGGFITSIDFGGGPLMAAGLSDGFVALFSGTGEHQWSKRVGSAPSDRVWQVAFDAYGNAVVSGETWGSVDLGAGALVSAGTADVFVGKLDPSGAHIWSRIFGDVAEQRPNALAIGRNDTLILGGSFAGTLNFGEDTLVSGGDDAFLAAFGP